MRSKGLSWKLGDLLLVRGAQIDLHWAYLGDLKDLGSFLQMFSERGYLAAVAYLLDHSTDIEDRGGQNANALQVAWDAGYVDVVEVLLQRGAGVNAPGKALGTAIQAAERRNHEQIVKLLREHGAGI